ncbi:cytochrome P450 [Bradyrhizobium sp. UFLA05-109]
MPFGNGPRICIGSSFALPEATIVLASLVHRLDMEPSPGAPKFGRRRKLRCGWQTGCPCT